MSKVIFIRNFSGVFNPNLYRPPRRGGTGQPRGAGLRQTNRVQCGYSQAGNRGAGDPETAVRGASGAVRQRADEQQDGAGILPY